MISFDISRAKGYNFGNESVSEVYYGSIRIWPRDYSLDYLTIESLDDNNTVTLYNAGDINNLSNIYYSLDNGYSWAQYSNPITLNQRRTLLLKGNITSNDNGSINICSTEECNVYGNIMSLLYSDNFVGQSSLLNKNYLFKSLFTNNSNICKVIDASNLILPATTLVSNCYYGMFSGCTSLTTAPALPATTLASYCYYAMFSSCTSLTTAPALPATTLAYGCYEGMFKNCVSLVNAPTLPAIQLKTLCYEEMFEGCTSLTTAPALPAIQLETLCYAHMFYGCTSLTTAPQLPATTLADECYGAMFYGCTSLTTAPALPATTLADYCYSFMFYGCTSLTTAPALPATTLADYCYQDMFSDCTSLTTAPALPATTLADYCYAYMFFRCTSLTTAPALPATTLADRCYMYMFYGCTSLTTAPALPATTLVNGCYKYMFSDCTSLTTAPYLLAKTLVDTCYDLMFYGCTNLNYIKCLATNISNITASNCTENWVQGVASTGTFIKSRNISSWTTGVNGIPRGWTVQEASYEDEYFTIESISNNNDISYTNTTNIFEYSINEGATWNTWTPNTNVTLNNGDKLLVRGNNPTVDGINGIGTFNATNNFNVVGNIMSLITPNFGGLNTLTNNYQFARLFGNNMYLINANDLQLPATTLSTGCYQYMFQRCYYLTTAPELPATALEDFCYRGMFYECYSLTTAPELPATILAPVCYETMFMSCGNLNYIKCLATDISAEDCTRYWVDHVAASGTFIKNTSMTNWSAGRNGVPLYWTIQDAS